MDGMLNSQLQINSCKTFSWLNDDFFAYFFQENFEFTVLINKNQIFLILDLNVSHQLWSAVAVNTISSAVVKRTTLETIMLLLLF